MVHFYYFLFDDGEGVAQGKVGVASSGLGLMCLRSGCGMWTRQSADQNQVIGWGLVYVVDRVVFQKVHESTTA